MTIPVAVLASVIAGVSAIFIAVVGALLNINSRLGKLEQGQEGLAAEIRASRERSDIQFATAKERSDIQFAAAKEHSDMQFAAAKEHSDLQYAAAKEHSDLQYAAAEERALARHNELLAEIRLWRTHRHDADGTIFFRVPE